MNCLGKDGLIHVYDLCNKGFSVCGMPSIEVNPSFEVMQKRNIPILHSVNCKCKEINLHESDIE